MTLLVEPSPTSYGASPHARRTPFFALDLPAVERSVDAFRAALPGCALHYAVKANPEIAVLDTLAAQGVGFEIASIYELELLRASAVDPRRIHFGTAVKPASHVRAAHDRGVRSFAADSLSEVDKIAQAAPGSEVFVRVRVDDSHSAFPFSEKFGCELDDVDRLVGRARATGLRVAGLSFHVGSQARRVHAWADALRSIAPALRRLASTDREVTVNLGGGFPVRYADGALVPTIGQIGDSIRSALGELPPVTLWAEPGRFVVAGAATLTASVIARVSRPDAEWLFLDAGCYNGLFEAMSYQGDTRYPAAPGNTRGHVEVRTFNLAGPTGDSADVIARHVALPADMAEGDTVVFSTVGAYTTSLSVPFNGFPRPTVHHA